MEEFLLAAGGAVGGLFSAEAHKQVIDAVEKVKHSLSTAAPESRVGDQVLSFLSQMGVQPGGR